MLILTSSAQCPLASLGEGAQIYVANNSRDKGLRSYRQAARANSISAGPRHVSIAASRR